MLDTVKEFHNVKGGIIVVTEVLEWNQIIIESSSHSVKTSN